MDKNVKVNEEELDWLIFRKPGDDYHQETFREKFVRKFKENPLVPTGALGTAGCLSVGLYFYMYGDSRKQQLMMRARVLAQGFTVAAFVLGLGVTAGSTLLKK